MWIFDTQSENNPQFSPKPRYFSSEMDSIQIVSDEVKDTDFAKTVIGTKKDEDAFQILDVGDVVAKHQQWLQKVPRVVPYFGKDLLLHS